MEDSLVAEELLKDLRKIAGADLLTCYFLNPHSGLFWLFFKDGEFEYDCQMHGPLTRPGQTERLQRIMEQENILNSEITVLDPLPAELSQNEYECDAFVKRERIARSIWITFSREKPVSHIEQRGVQFAVAVFLNYRSVWPQECETILSGVKERLPLLKKCLLSLVDQPCMLPDEAWRLRNVSLQFYKKLEEMLVGGPDVPKELYNFIVQQTFNLIKPEKGSNVLCTLALLDANNKPTVVASIPEQDPNKIKTVGGIVDYVGHSGQIYLVPDIEVYKKGKPNPACHPSYLPWEPKSCCELACPLIVQEKVVGVLNIEADEPEAYTKHHILMLLQFASLAGLAVRQVTLWQGLYKCIDAQSNALQSGIYCDDRRILELTIETAKALGYEADIWDFYAENSGKWCKSSSRRSPRKEGYTNWVKQNGCPIVLADIRKDDSGSVHFKTYKGILCAGTNLFRDWEEFTHPFDISDELKKEIEQLPPVLTDIGFPIFRDVPLKSEFVPEVRAVLWAKCRRPFKSMLHDENWALSFLSRNTSMALGIRDKTYSKHGDFRKELLKVHFGKNRTDEIQRAEVVLAPKFVDNVYVINLDIRGSTKMAAKLHEFGQASLFVKFLEEYHRMVYKTTIDHDGVFDKTMGDGDQVLFNIYQPSILNLPPGHNLLPLADSIECVTKIFEQFIELFQRHRRKWSYRPESGLGAALSGGSVFVGSFSPQEISGLDYTVVGNPANTAGKLVNLSRREIVKDWMQKGREQQVPPQYYDNRDIPDKEFNDVLTSFEDNGRTACILLFDALLTDNDVIQNKISNLVEIHGELKALKIRDPNTCYMHTLLALFSGS